jgi:hypothetical protein
LWNREKQVQNTRIGGEPPSFMLRCAGGPPLDALHHPAAASATVPLMVTVEEARDRGRARGSVTTAAKTRRMTQKSIVMLLMLMPMGRRMKMSLDEDDDDDDDVHQLEDADDWNVDEAEAAECVVEDEDGDAVEAPLVFWSP